MGYPKSMIKVDGVPLCEIIYQRAKNITDNVVFLGEAPLSAGIKNPTKIKDSYDSGGPFKAVYSDYDYKKTDWFFWAIDMPLITEKIILHILSQREKMEDVIPYNRNRMIYEPFCGYYSKKLLKQLTMLYSDKLYNIQRMLAFLEVKGCSEIFDLYQDEFRNWNSIEDIPKQYLKSVTMRNK